MTFVKQYSNPDVFGQSELPFKVNFNFKKLFDHWEQLAKGDDPGQALVAKSVLEKLSNAPELRGSFDDIKLLEKYQEEINLLMSVLFSPLLENNEIKACCFPFAPIIFNPNQRFRNILNVAGDPPEISLRVTGKDQLYIHACVFILNVVYGANINFKALTYFDIPDKNNDIMRNYRAFFNGEFSSFIPSENFRELSPEEIKELTDNYNNIDLWKEKIPPNSFTYEGFAIANLFDVTLEEAISELKYDLLEKDALIIPEKVERIRHNIERMLNLKDLRLGFAVFDPDRDSIKSIGYGLWNSILLSDKPEQKCTKTFCNYSYNHIFDNKEVLAISEIRKDQGIINPLYNKLIEEKLKSYIAVPLVYNSKVIGFLELGSKKINELNTMIANNLDAVIPLFTTALKRSKDEMETRLEVIIQEKCTSIHPSVSWRFFEAAENLLLKQRHSDTNEMEEIIFENLYPLYGQSDIKSSSTQRNHSIQSDLIEQLELAKGVMEMGMKKMQLPICDKLAYQINNYIKKAQKELGAGDELKALEFLKNEIYPVFAYLKESDTELEAAIAAYNNELDKDLGVVYKKRKDYEESVAAINEKISGTIEKAQEQAQKMFPHYFEKYKTDGVEHNIYIGQSLVNNRKFHQLYLHNLRLWQLIAICETENAVKKLQSELEVPLQICSLILIHSNPLSIRFRQDEKQFDVDGAYNVRYEIIKKRIDKAYIKGTEERLTQPEKIAIVYSNEKDAREYLQYLQYLQSINYIEDKIEWLDLSDMQGVSGLKAIRVKVIYDQNTAKKHSRALPMAELEN